MLKKKKTARKTPLHLQKFNFTIMKNYVPALMLMALSLGVKAQQSSPWPGVAVSNANQSGYVGIGTKSTTTTTNTPLPNFNLHLHGTADWLIPQNFPLAPLNAGKTFRLGITNTTTGRLASDGVELRLSENNFFIRNQEAGNLIIGVPTVEMLYSNSSSRLWVGTLSNLTNANQARMNIIAPTNENGFYIEAPATSGKYGLSVRMINNTSDAIQVNGSINFFGSLIPVKNFSVKGNGEVFARKYTTTLAPIPDYVFDSSYKLLPLNELKSYISLNKHLPNIPSAKDYETRGEIDLGELNLLLLEKVEELTLYILQLEERMKALENK
jgi:hypothetical protein